MGVLLGFAVIVDGLVTVARVFTSAPTIEPPLPDSQEAAPVPFMVSNNGSFTLHSVYARCGITDVVVGGGASIPTVGLQNRGSTLGEVPPHDHRQFTCPIDVKGIKEAHVWLEASWTLHLLRVIPWKQRREYAFELKRLSDGRLDWQGRR